MEEKRVLRSEYYQSLSSDVFLVDHSTHTIVMLYRLHFFLILFTTLRIDSESRIKRSGTYGDEQIRVNIAALPSPAPTTAICCYLINHIFV